MTDHANIESRKPQKVHINWTREEPSDEDSSPLDWMDEKEDAERIAAWHDGAFEMIGIRAKAEIMIPIGGDNFRCMTLRSAGLWGIESDSGEDYLADVFGEQKADLLSELRTLAEGLGDAIQS